MVGFTGVVWDSRPLPQLAADLASGPGPVPIAEAGFAYGALALEIADIGIEYGKILADLGLHWESATYNHAIAKLTQLVPWFADYAIKASDATTRVEVQAAAHTVALLTMPSIPEIQITEELERLLGGLGPAVGVPIMGAVAATERARADQKQRAARVMQSYEQASTPMAKPWAIAAKPPQIVSDAALKAEEAARKAAAENAKKDKETKSTGGGGTGGGAGGGGGAKTQERTKSKYAVTNLANAGGQQTISQAGGNQSTSSSTGRMPSAMPLGGAMGAMNQNNRNDEHTDNVAVPSSAGIADDADGVNLPGGWLGNTAQNEDVTWADLEGDADNNRPPEGVLNLAPPAVIGAGER